MTHHDKSVDTLLATGVVLGALQSQESIFRAIQVTDSDGLSTNQILLLLAVTEDGQPTPFRVTVEQLTDSVTHPH